MTRTVWWCVLGILSVAIIAIDVGKPSFIDFQPMYSSRLDLAPGT